MNKEKKLPNSVRGMLITIHLFSVIIIVLVGAVFFFQINMPKETYFQVNTNGLTTPMEALDEPNISSDTLLSWATLAATSAFAVDFVTYNETLESLREYFTITGYENYIKSQNKLGRLDQIVSDKLIVSSVLLDTPVILQEGLAKGYYSWRIQIPLLVTYLGASEDNYEQELVITLLVRRVPTKDAPKGIGIEQFTADPFFGV
jgi:intracellular multiplication protein IcmL